VATEAHNFVFCHKTDSIECGTEYKTHAALPSAFKVLNTQAINV